MWTPHPHVPRTQREGHDALPASLECVKQTEQPFERMQLFGIKTMQGQLLSLKTGLGLQKHDRQLTSAGGPVRC